MLILEGLLGHIPLSDMSVAEDQVPIEPLPDPDHPS